MHNESLLNQQSAKNKLFRVSILKRITDSMDRDQYHSFGADPEDIIRLVLTQKMRENGLGSIFLTWFNFNPSMDK